MIEPIKSRFATLLWPLYLVNADPQHVVGPNLLGSRQRLARVLGPGHRLTLGAEVVLAEAVLAGDTVVVLLGRWVEHGGIVKVVLKKRVHCLETNICCSSCRACSRRQFCRCASRGRLVRSGIVKIVLKPINKSQVFVNHTTTLDTRTFQILFKCFFHLRT